MQIFEELNQKVYEVEKPVEDGQLPFVPPKMTEDSKLKYTFDMDRTPIDF